jgi:hypothetical protein
MPGSKKGHIKKRKKNGKLATGRPTIYTLDFCKKEIKELLTLILSDIPNKEKPTWKYITLYDLVKGRGYCKQRISEWKKAFEYDDEFMDSIKRIYDELENRLFKLGMISKTSTAMAIFGLKNNFNWKDTNQTEVILPKGDIEVEYGFIDKKNENQI